MSKLYRRPGSPFYYAAIGKCRFSTRTDVKAKALIVLKRREQEIWERGYDLVDFSGKRPDEFFQKYMEWVTANRRFHTARSYGSITRCFRRFLTAQGVTRMGELNQAILEDYILGRTKVNKRWSVNNHIVALKAILTKAEEWHYLRKNPAKRLKKLEVTDAKVIKCLSEEECGRLLRACQGDEPYYYSMFLAFMTTGLRLGELLNLEWSDIDFDRGLIFVRIKADFAPKGKDLRANRAKERVLPVPRSVLEVLRAKQRESNYVFTDIGGKRFSKHKPRRILLKLAKLAEIPALTRLHELRHTYASLLLGKGVHILHLKELLGHSDIRDTQRYSHMLPEHIKATAGLIENLELWSPEDGVPKLGS